MCSILAIRNPELRGPYVEDTIIAIPIKEVSDRVVGPQRYSPPFKTPLSYHITPWSGGQYIYPLSATTNPPGYSQFYITTPIPPEQSDGIYKIYNAIDGYLYCKAGALGTNDILSNPDLVLAPYQKGRMDTPGTSLSFISQAAGHDFYTPRPAWNAISQSQFNTRGPAAGIYLVNGDRELNITVPHGYQRIYDIYDLTTFYPNNPTNRASAGAATLSVATSGSSNTALVFNGADSTGATSVEGRINILTAPTGRGTVCTLHLGSISAGSTGTQTVSITSIDFSLAVGEVRVPPTNNGLDMDVCMWMSIPSAVSFSIDEAYIMFNMGSTT